MARKGRAAGAAAAMIAPADLESSPGGEAPAPVYILAGGESVLRSRAVEALRRRVLDPEFESFNYRVLDPAGMDGAALAQELRVLPMGAGGRLVVIHAAEKLLKDQLEALGGYAAEPAPGTCLALAAAEVKEALRKAFKDAVTVDCTSPWEDRIPGALMEEARRMGVRLEPAAAAALARRCGRDLSRAVSELGKLAVAAGDKPVTQAIVDEVAGGEGPGDVFKVASALARGDAAAAVAAARLTVETDSDAEPRILYELGLHLRRLLAARGGLASGMSPRDAARSAGVFWKDLDAFAAGLRHWSDERIRESYRRLLEADRRVKRGGEGMAAIEAYLWSLPVRSATGPGPGAGRPG